jgi:diguanylate cyclase (GGDEF)-like protein
MFATARAAGRLSELDEACRAAAFRGAVAHNLLAPTTVFVNVEPDVLDSAPLADLPAIADTAPREPRIVLEVTERALAARPAELLRTVERVRALLGWGIALDDVGADPMSLSFMPLLRPDVVKLDLRLVQGAPGPEVAQVMNAVNAYAESTGALVLAEGIENAEHLATARSLGASLGQGWLFGRPESAPSLDRPSTELFLPSPEPADLDEAGNGSPFACLPEGTRLRFSPKSLLVELSKQLEREAVRVGQTCVVAATFQEARHVTPATERRYAELARATGFVCAVGEGLDAEPLPGIRGATLRPADPVRDEWDVVVLGVVTVDLEGVDDVADRFGDAAADDLLRAVAQRLRGRLRHGDLVGRIGTGRFAAAVPRLAPASAGPEAVRIAGVLAHAMSGPFMVAGEEVVLGVRVGSALCPADSDDVADLLAIARTGTTAVRR